MFFSVSATDNSLDNGIDITFKSFNSSTLLSLADHFRELELNDVTIRKSYLPILSRQMFGVFKNVRNLKLEYTTTQEIEGAAFHDLHQLTNLHITNNELTSFKPSVLNSSHLVYLNISNNLISSLSDFNISTLRSLTVLDISNNSLEFLPKDILDTLNTSTHFFLIIDNNPWNCSHPSWKDNLSSEYIVAFCSNTSREQKSFDEIEEQHLVEQTNSTRETPQSCSDNILKDHCPFWIFGALWTGVILGNIRKLKQLVFCPKNIILEEKSTQCGE